MTYKLIQSIFLIIGTAIGAGILALPISTSYCGFEGAIFALVTVWFFMSFAAFNLLKARLVIAKEADLDIMTAELLGPSINYLVKVCFLILLMALLSLYITVGSAWVIDLSIKYLDLSVPTSLAQIGFTFVIGSIVYSGLGNLAQINQVITLAKVGFLFTIIVVSSPYLETDLLSSYHLEALPSTLSMLTTTFGFSIILPSLASYLQEDRKKLYASLFVASVFILMTYIAWELITFGVIGPEKLSEMADLKDKGTGVVQSLSQIVQNSNFNAYGLGIMITAVLTSFLGVGQSTFSYLKDVLPGRNMRRKSLLAVAVGFTPPLLIIHFYPTGISTILSFAGIFVSFILGIIPTLMILSKTYQIRLKKPNSLTTKFMAYSTLLFFLGIILFEIYKMI